MDTIDWSKYFDKIYCEFFVPNKNRMPLLQSELQRVGIQVSPVFEFVYNTPSCFDVAVLDYIRNRPNHLPLIKASYANHLMCRERILRRSLAEGHQRILILEDDICFLRDITKIQDVLDTMPLNYDVFQMDKFVPPKKRSAWEFLKFNHRLNNNWVSSQGITFTSAACMAYTKKGMEDMIRIIESCPGSVDRWGQGYRGKWAISIPNLAIQLFYGNSCNLSNMKIENLHSVYRGIVDYSLYNCPKGYPSALKCL